MLLPYTNGATSVILRVIVQQDSTGTSPGDGFAGLTSSSSGLIVSTICDNEATPTVYTVAGSTIQSITTLGIYAAPSTNECRLKLVDGTNHPGLIELQFANARFAVSGAKELTITLSGVSGMKDCNVKVPLQSVNVYDAIHGGMSALPNTACTTNASLLTSGTGTDQLSVTSGVAKANFAQILGTALTETAGQLAAGFKQFFNIASPTSTMNLVTAVTTVTTTTTATNLTNAPTAGDFTSTMKTSLNAATPTVTLATSQPNYAPATAESLASLVTTVGTAGAGLTSLPAVTLATSQPNYAPAKVSDLGTVQTGDLFAVVNPMITTHVFTAPALANAPTGSGGGTDPWLTNLPGSYTSGTAGYIVGHNIDAAISSRSTFAGGAVASVTGDLGGSIHGVTSAAVAEIQSGLAAASQIPSHFTSSTFASDGVFATAALANGPSGGGGSGNITSIGGTAVGLDSSNNLKVSLDTITPSGSTALITTVGGKAPGGTVIGSGTTASAINISGLFAGLGSNAWNGQHLDRNASAEVRTIASSTETGGGVYRITVAVAFNSAPGDGEIISILG